MIHENTYLEAADNSGAKKLMCIRVLGGSKKRYAKVGDIIKVTHQNRQTCLWNALKFKEDTEYNES